MTGKINPQNFRLIQSWASRRDEVIRLFVAILLSSFEAMALAEDPDCSGIDRWPTRSALVRIANAGIVDKVDFAKTKTTRLASERIGQDLYRQVHRVIYTERSGKIIEAVVVNDVSSEECSMSSVEVFVVSKRLGSTE